MNYKELEEKVKKPEYKSLVAWIFAYRTVAVYAVKLFVKTPIKPNQITIFELILFVASVIFVGTGQHQYMVIGAVMGFICVYLDYFDGSLARAKGIVSQFGKALDTAGFYLESILIPISMISALYIQTGSDIILLLGAVLIVNTFVYYMGIKSILNENKEDEIQPTGQIPKIRFATLFEFDTRLLFFWLGCLFNQLIYVFGYFLLWSFYALIEMILKYRKRD